MRVVDLYPEKGTEVIEKSGEEFVENFGEDVVKNIIKGIFSGENLRNRTEMLTRKRLALSNGALIMLYLNGLNQESDFVEKLPDLTAQQITDCGGKDEEWVLNWVVGLTNKGKQNILRDDLSEIEDYMEDLREVMEETTQEMKEEFGEISFVIEHDDNQFSLGWEEFLYISMAIGSQTLTIRGSEKSAYGKLFEDLILGSVLNLLGFEFIPKDAYTGDRENVFWFKSTETGREPDATLITEPGQGVRFDIGFIGRGNPEISLDKVSRYEREIELSQKHHYMATFVLVDRIGDNSDIKRQAKAIDGFIFQMSMSYWPKEIAQKLEEKIGYRHEILDIEEENLEDYFEEKLEDIDIQKFLGDIESHRQDTLDVN